MKTNLYRITVQGCDDNTSVVTAIDNEKEIKFIKDISENINNTSYYGCMPTLEIKKIETYSDWYELIEDKLYYESELIDFYFSKEQRELNNIELEHEYYKRDENNITQVKKSFGILHLELITVDEKNHIYNFKKLEGYDKFMLELEGLKLELEELKELEILKKKELEYDSLDNIGKELTNILDSIGI